ncbi:exodeoxyribonuclease V, 135 kDa subunit [Marinomonas sp. MED121]|uniref:exodeoxyribonuclease V subunit beta n=1 Tax=Marinomonas sp. MED121 TaxID=314277 RepID=UPI000068FBEB|nr:exodeoxyribonuclease V subunit beta [Marinomonas sp. MED121]EAQ63779.1 exodeoxyribonuclease V, 135 kDa subunit [Marinomonas sp. MED121]
MSNNNLLEAVHALDALDFPLFGKRLIEASAGTGKTYTIANLYLRLLLPIDSKSGFERALTVDEILVVTFTEAATAELKARIRNRIREARKALLLGQTKDPFLSQLLASMTEAEIALGVERLLYAEKQMDEAAIFTIHGFCQRMLSQNAFESRMLFQQEIETDEQAPLAMAIKDVWRSNIYPMTSDIAALVKPIWPTPEALQKELSLLQNQPDAIIQDAISGEIKTEAFDLSALMSKAQESIKKVKSVWLEQAANILDALTNSGIKGTFWGKRQAGIPDIILDWAQSDTISLPPELKKFNAREHSHQLKKNGAQPNHSFFELVANLIDSYPSVEKIKAPLMASLWQQTQVRLLNWKQQTQKLTFTDLLTNLDQALAIQAQDETADNALAKRIRQLYPLAMIDEFQDTDPVQYRIFSQIYQPASQANNRLGLIMIGDPKQAIYAFRGADIYTYLAAKKEVDAIYSLATNYRSSAAMIQSVNALFSTQGNPFLVEGIPFVKVEDRQTQGQFYRKGKLQAAMQFMVAEDGFSDDAVLSSAQYQIQMAQLSAEHICQTLIQAQEGEALISSNPVRSGDIAVLVSGYRQAQLMKAALSARGVASVYLSDRGSVFASNEARELLLILNAILSQGKESAIRSALATHLLGWQVDELDTLNQDDVLYEDWVERFKTYFDIWHKDGVLPMIRALIQALSLAPKLLAGMQGERRLTDLLHLGEKLQQKAKEFESKEGLVRYLALAIQTPNGDSDEQKIRLESDDELVRIITIHKSKGLEYPLVYLPFAFTPFRINGKYALYHDDTHQLNYAPVPDEDQLNQHEKELYAGEVRLAYVALTRAREACFIGCAQVGKAATKTKEAELNLHLSGVGSLLCEGKAVALGELESKLKGFLQAYDNEQMALTLLASEQSLLTLNAFSVADEDDENEVKAQHFSGHIERDWWVGSYSSLVVEQAELASEQEKEHSEPGLDESVTVSSEILEQASALDEAVLTDLDNEEPSCFTFPKGAKPGTFLHDLLEGNALLGELDKVSFADLLKTQYQAKMTEYFINQGYEEWQTVLFAWLEDILKTPLYPGLNLLGLTSDKCFKEMEFFLPVAGFNARQLDQIARQYDAVSLKAPAIQERPLKGMLKGFIDLLFEHEGKYFVLDYKSNHIGMSYDDYQAHHMAEAIAEHRYDLQYQLYTLALHRLLKQRLPNYDYDEHVGGVCYLFLRGMRPSKVGDESSNQKLMNETGVFKTRLSKEHVQALDDMFNQTRQEVPQIELF